MESIEHLQNMGFSREQAEEALRVADNNVEKAVAFLFDGSVEIANKQDIPSEMLAPAPPPRTTDPMDTDASDVSSRSSVRMSNSTDSLNEFENMDLELRPPVEPRGECPMAVFCARQRRYENYLVPILLALRSVAQFHDKLTQAEGTPLLDQVRRFYDSLAATDTNYVVNEFAVEESADSVEELIPRLFETLDQNYAEAYDDHFVEQALKSTVLSRDEESRQDMFILEIDSDSRYRNVYDTLNELFWGKDLEGLGNICFDKVGQLLTLYYVGDEDDEYSRFRPQHASVVELRDEIYPGIYGAAQLERLVALKQQYDQLNDEGRALNRAILQLKIFQGRKIDGVLAQAAAFVAQQPHGAAVQRVVDNIDAHKAAKHAELDRLIAQIEAHDVRRLDNLGALDDPYKLVLVMVSDTEYYYYEAGRWVYSVQTGGASPAIRTQYLTFDDVNEAVQARTGQSAAPLGLMYCQKTALRNPHPSSTTTTSL